MRIFPTDSYGVPQALPPDPGTIPGRVYYAWKAADGVVNDAMDANTRDQYIFWLVSPATPAPAKAMIMAQVTWAGAIWKQYTRVYKPAILAGADPTLDYVGICGASPYTFSQIADAADPPSP